MLQTLFIRLPVPSNIIVDLERNSDEFILMADEDVEAKVRYKPDMSTQLFQIVYLR